MVEFDDGYQELKSQLMKTFDRAARSVDSAAKKTREMQAALDEDEEKLPDDATKKFPTFKRINGAQKGA